MISLRSLRELISGLFMMLTLTIEPSMFQKTLFHVMKRDLIQFYLDPQVASRMLDHVGEEFT